MTSIQKSNRFLLYFAFTQPTNFASDKLRNTALKTRWETLDLRNVSRRASHLRLPCPACFSLQNFNFYVGFIFLQINCAMLHYSEFHPETRLRNFLYDSLRYPCISSGTPKSQRSTRLFDTLQKKSFLRIFKKFQ